MSRRFNPWRLFHGAWVPEWLMRSPGISPGAKLCYARLCRYAGEKGHAYPEQEELAAELAVSVRSVRNYLRELEEHGLIETVQQGMGDPNVYYFLWPSGLLGEGSDRQDPAGLDRQDAATHERQDPAGPSSPRESASESSSRAERRDVTPKRERPARRRAAVDTGDDLEAAGRLEAEPEPTNLRLLKPRRGWTTHTLVESFAQRALAADSVVSAARDTNKGALGKTIKKWQAEGTATPDQIAAAMDTFFLAPASRLQDNDATLWLAFVNHYSSIVQTAATSMHDPDHYQEPSVKHSLAAWAADR